MSEHDQSGKFVDESAASANDVLQAERSAQAIEQSYSATVERMRNYNKKMIEVEKKVCLPYPMCLHSMCHHR